MSDFAPENLGNLTKPLTPEQQEALIFLQEELPKIINDLKNNNPDKLPDVLERLTKRGEKILPDGEKVVVPSPFELITEAIKVNNQEALKAAERVKSGITPPSTPFPLNENPNSLSSTPQKNLKK
jgi:hypothetical protein